MKVYGVLFDEVIMEEQPYITGKGSTGEEARLMNFRLQQIDMGIRGLAIAAGKQLITVVPNSVRSFLKTKTGDYNENKKIHVKYCSDRGFVFKDLAPMQRHHVADTLCNVLYVLSKTEGLKLSDLLTDNAGDQSFKSYRAFSKGRPECNALSRDRSSPSFEEGSGGSDS